MHYALSFIEEILKISQLSYLELTDKEISKLQKELSDIIRKVYNNEFSELPPKLQRQLETSTKRVPKFISKATD